MTKKALFLSLLVLVAAAGQIFAHAGEVHSYMGTLTAIEGDGSYKMKTTKGQYVSFVTAKTTTYRFADNSPATAADLTAGARVVVEVSKDGKTASSVKIAQKQQ